MWRYLMQSWARPLAGSLVLAGLSVVPSVARAQTETADGLKIDAAPEQPMWMAVLFAMVLTVAVGVGSFISAKRTHQD